MYKQMICCSICIAYEELLLFEVAIKLLLLYTLNEGTFEISCEDFSFFLHVMLLSMCGFSNEIL